MLRLLSRSTAGRICQVHRSWHVVSDGIGINWITVFCINLADPIFLNLSDELVPYDGTSSLSYRATVGMIKPDWSLLWLIPGLLPEPRWSSTETLATSTL